MWQGRKKIPRMQTAFDFPASISYSRDQLNVETDSFLICLASLDQIAVLRVDFSMCLVSAAMVIVND